MSRLRVSLAATVISLCACDDCPEKPDDCVENTVSVTQGVYGQVLEGDDVERDPDCRAYGQPEEWFDVWLVAADGNVVGSDTTNEVGGYEIPIAPGEYKLCVLWPYDTRARCYGNLITAPATGRVRVDIWTNALSTSAAPRGPALCGRAP